MKILLGVPEYPPNHIGGGGIVFKNLAESYSKLGHNVLVLSGDYKKNNIFSSLKIESIGGINIIRIPELYTPISLLNTVMPFPFWYNKSLKQYINDFSPDFIHIHGYGLFMPSQLANICQKIGKKYTLTLHGAPLSPEKMGNKIISFAYLFYNKFYGIPSIENAEKLTAVSNFTKEFEIFKKWKDKITVVSNGITFNDYYNPGFNIFQKKGIGNNEKNVKIIFSLGRIEWIKGFDKIIKIIPEMIKKTGYNIHYVIAGRDNGEKTKLIELASKYGISEKVHFIGYIDGNDKISALFSADIIAIPSISESYGLVGLEARACQKPILTTFAGGLKDALKGYSQAFNLYEYEKIFYSENSTFYDTKLTDYSWINIAKKYLDN